MQFVCAFCSWLELRLWLRFLLHDQVCINRSLLHLNLFLLIRWLSPMVVRREPEGTQSDVQMLIESDNGLKLRLVNSLFRPDHL